ncbi:MAG TPA: hypothetical protein VJ748_08615 [Vitreimonas sp.]|jgi:hypothetical protein|nr:hypothetical protein [Vitreimonas sp.]
MSPPEGPRNPEHRSTNAILCFCIGAALAGGAWFLGVGTVMGAALSGGNPALVVGGAIAAIALVLASIAGGVLMLIGTIWMVIQVIADQTGEKSEKRYRDVER